MSDTVEILEQAARWREAGKGVALATVVNTWGSSPRPLGTMIRPGLSGSVEKATMFWASWRIGRTISRLRLK